MSDEYYFEAINSLDEGFCVIDVKINETGKPVDWKYLAINPEYIEQGGSADDVGQLVSVRYPRTEQLWFDFYGNVALSGIPARMEGKLKAPDKWYEIYAAKIGGQESRTVCALFRDITERKRAEEALCESEKKYRVYITEHRQEEEALRKIEERESYLLKVSDILRSFSDEKSIQEATTRLLVEHLKVSQSNYTDYTKDDLIVQSEMLGDNTLTIKGTFKRSEMSAAVAILCSGRDVIYSDVLNYTEVSEELRAYWLSLNIRADISVPIFRDGMLAATLSVRQSTPRVWSPEEVELVHETAERTWTAIERARAKDALQEEERRLQAVLSDMTDAFFFYDHDWRFVTANGHASKYFGRSPSELIGRNVYEMYPQMLGSITSSEFYRAMSEGTPVHFEAKSNINDRYFEAHAYPDETGLAVFLRDITLRKKYEAALRESEAKARKLVQELENADKNKNQFISVMSHELRNPLAVISAGLALFEAADKPEQIKMSKEIIKRQINQLTKMVDDLLDLTRINQNKIKLKTETINLASIIKDAAIDIQAEFIAKGIQLRTKLQPKCVFILADPVRINQCVSNLFWNALKYTSEGGDVELSLSSEAGEAIISVRDTGRGIDSELLKHIFEPFKQSGVSLNRPTGSGLGLGLSIVDGIVQLHGGHITAFSEGIGKGSIFTIRLPILADTDNSLSSPMDIKKPCKPHKILLIEDNKDLVDILLSMFSSFGHFVFAAYNGKDGISEAKNFLPDIIFCDIGLPDINGYDVAKLIRADTNLKNVFLVALTGYADELSIGMAVESGFDRHLAKPLDMAMLERILADI